MLHFALFVAATLSRLGASYAGEPLECLISVPQRDTFSWAQLQHMDGDYCRIACKEMGYPFFSLECPRPDRFGLPFCSCIEEYQTGPGFSVSDVECKTPRNHCAGPVMMDSNGYWLGSFARAFLYNTTTESATRPLPQKPPPADCLNSRQREDQAWLLLGKVMDSLVCERACKERGFPFMSLECPSVSRFWGDVYGLPFCSCIGSFLTEGDWSYQTEECLANENQCVGPHVAVDGFQQGSFHKAFLYDVEQLPDPVEQPFITCLQSVPQRTELGWSLLGYMEASHCKHSCSELGFPFFGLECPRHDDEYLGRPHCTCLGEYRTDPGYGFEDVGECQRPLDHCDGPAMLDGDGYWLGSKARIMIYNASAPTLLPALPPSPTTSAPSPTTTPTPISTPTPPGVDLNSTVEEDLNQPRLCCVTDVRLRVELERGLADALQSYQDVEGQAAIRHIRSVISLATSAECEWARSPCIVSAVSELSRIAGDIAAELDLAWVQSATLVKEGDYLRSEGLHEAACLAYSGDLAAARTG